MTGRKPIVAHGEVLAATDNVVPIVRKSDAEAALVARIVDLAFTALFPEVRNGEVPNHFVLTTNSRTFRIGNLSAASPADVPILANVDWLGSRPLYGVSVISPCLHLAGYGLHERWTLTRTSVFCTAKSKRKLAQLEEALGRGTKSETHELGEIASPFTPAGCAVAQDFTNGSETKVWSALPGEHREEARKWCAAQPYTALVKLRGLEVHQIFRTSAMQRDRGDWKVPEIEVCKLL
ncbi:MAG: hypothetical protein JWN34_5220 [Bryobacterales bacterium]|nr:hypothetical protein [Bryobacterales bacterium]